MSSIAGTPLSDWKVHAWRTWLFFVRFVRRYGTAMLALASSAIIGWTVADGVSDYTRGGWEIHIIQSELGINLHFHHWFYGLPLYLIAFLLIDRASKVSIFLFGLGESLAAHSYINERGIPSIFEGGPTIEIPPEVYFPIITALGLLYAFFLIRREEWIARASEREEIAESYLYPKTDTSLVVQRVDEWAARHLRRKESKYDPDHKIEYGHWHALDTQRNGEWQLYYVISPFDDLLNLLVIRLEHVPIEGRTGQLDDWIQELDATLRPLAKPAVEGPAAAHEYADMTEQAQLINRGL